MFDAVCGQVLDESRAAGQPAARLRHVAPGEQLERRPEPAPHSRLELALVEVDLVRAGVGVHRDVDLSEQVRRARPGLQVLGGEWSDRVSSGEGCGRLVPVRALHRRPSPSRVPLVRASRCVSHASPPRAQRSGAPQGSEPHR